MELPSWLANLTIKEINEICKKHMDSNAPCGDMCKLGKYGFWDDLENYDPIESGWFGYQCMFACFYAGIHQERM